MNLNETQLSAIEQVIGQSKLSIGEMKDDILDHLCCDVESRMGQGQNFEQAFTESLRSFSPGGLDEIEKESFLLLNPKFLQMKKLMFGSGLIFSIMIAVGLQLKMLHLAGAAELLVLGMSGFGLVFLPLMLKFNASRNTSKPSAERRKELLGYLSGYVLAVGGVLKVIHVTPANEVILLGTIVFSFGFLPYYFLALYRKSMAN